MNKLVDLLQKMGKTDRSSTMKRDTAARMLELDVRQVKALAEESRLSGKAPVVCYRSDARMGGYYLTGDADEIRKMEEKILRECRHRLRQLKALRTARQGASPGGQRTLRFD